MQKEYTLHAWPFSVKMTPSETTPTYTDAKLLDIAGNILEVGTYPNETAQAEAAQFLKINWIRYFENCLEVRKGKRTKAAKEERALVEAKLASPFTYDRIETFTA